MSTLTHRETGYFIRFGFRRALISPGPNVKEEHLRYFSDHSQADSRCRACKTWLTELRQEVDALDLWGLLEEKATIFLAISTPDNAPFTDQEQGLIETRLKLLEHRVREVMGNQADPSGIIADAFGRLNETKETFGRKDWFNLLIGTIVNIIVNVAMDGNKAREILTGLGAFFHWVTGSAMPSLK